MVSRRPESTSSSSAALLAAALRGRRLSFLAGVVLLGVMALLAHSLRPTRGGANEQGVPDRAATADPIHPVERLSEVPPNGVHR